MSRLIIFVLEVISIVFAIITLGLSFWQINDEYTNVFVGMVNCDSKGVQTPFYATSTVNGVTSEMQCTWSTTRSAVRILYLLLFLILSVLYFVSVFRKSTIFFLVITALICADGVLGFYCFIADGKDARRGHSFCKNSDLNGIGAVECKSYSFYATTAMGVLTVAMMYVVVGLSILQRSKLFGVKKYTNQTDN